MAFNIGIQEHSVTDMKLFIVREVLYDHSSGMVAIKAKDMDEARMLFQNWIDSYAVPHYAERFKNEFDKSISAGYFKTFDLAFSDKNETGVVTQVWGSS